jgi:organic hydroperoxide reductase OsmC/OhrA
MADGQGELGGSGLRVVHSIPGDLGGRGNGTNPEELLAAASASCAMITLSAIVEASGGGPLRLRCQTAARFESRPSGPVPVSIEHEIQLIPPVPPGLDKEQTAGLVERGCMISRALAGNVTVKVRIVDAADPESL